MPAALNDNVSSVLASLGVNPADVTAALGGDTSGLAAAVSSNANVLAALGVNPADVLAALGGNTSSPAVVLGSSSSGLTATLGSNTADQAAAPEGNTGGLTPLGTLRDVAGVGQLQNAPVVITPSLALSDIAIFTQLQAAVLPLINTPVLGPAELFASQLSAAWTAGQDIHFLITFPAVSSASSEAPVLQQINTVSLAGTLVPSGVDFSSGTRRLAFTVSFEDSADRVNDPNFVASLNQFTRDSVKDFRLVPRMADEGLLNNLAQLGAGQGLDYLIVPELSSQAGTASVAPGAAAGGPEPVVVPSGAGLFPFATATEGARLLQPEDGSGALVVFNEDGTEIASAGAGQSLMTSDLPAGTNFFVVEFPRTDSTQQPLTELVSGQLAEGEGETTRPVAALVPLTTAAGGSAAGGSAAPVIATLLSNVGGEGEVLEAEAASTGAPENRFLAAAVEGSEHIQPAVWATDRGGTSGGNVLTAVWQALGEEASPQAGPMLTGAALPAATGLQVLGAVGWSWRVLPQPPGVLNTLWETARSLAGAGASPPLSPRAARPTLPDVLIPELPEEEAGPQARGENPQGGLVPGEAAYDLLPAGEHRPDRPLLGDGQREEKALASLVVLAAFVAGGGPLEGWGASVRGTPSAAALHRKRDPRA